MDSVLESQTSSLIRIYRFLISGVPAMNLYGLLEYWTGSFGHNCSSLEPPITGVGPHTTLLYSHRHTRSRVNRRSCE